MSRRFDERREIINRIRGGHRSHRDRTTRSHPAAKHELPTIVSSLTACPVTEQAGLGATIFSKFGKKGMENELDMIISETLSNFKNQRINKIIFSSRFDRTVYGDKEYATVNATRSNQTNRKRRSSIEARGSAPPHLNRSLISKSKPLEHPYSPDFLDPHI